MLIVLMMDGLLSMVGGMAERVTDAAVLDKKERYFASLEGEFAYPNADPQYHASPLSAELAKRGYAPAIQYGREAYRQIEKDLPPRKR
jgi:hypothetical protein